MSRVLRVVVAAGLAVVAVLVVRLTDDTASVSPRAAETPPPTLEPVPALVLESGRVGCEVGFDDVKNKGATPVEAARLAGHPRGTLKEVWRHEDAAVVTETVDGKVVAVYRTGGYQDGWLTNVISYARECPSN